MCVSYRYLWMIGLGSYYRRCSVMLVTRVYGFGGLSVVAQLVNQTVLDPETQGRNSLLASVFGLAFLVASVLLTSVAADKLIGPKMCLSDLWFLVARLTQGVTFLDTF
ncbi:uncharacterized protein [Rutidosis leptorrhynchoides]